MENETTITQRTCRLSDLRIGHTAEIFYIDETQVPDVLRERLADHGIHTGERITCIYSGLWGDPKAYAAEISHTVVAIRNKDAMGIWVKKTGGDVCDRMV